MRGHDTQQAGMFSYLSPEARVPVTPPAAAHPAIRQYVDTALTALLPQLEQLYVRTGPPSIAPEKLLRALLLQVLYSLRRERLLMEELQYNLLFRWFVGLDLDAPVYVEALSDAKTTLEGFFSILKLAQDESGHVDDQQGDDGQKDEESLASNGYQLRTLRLDGLGSVLDVLVSFGLPLNQGIVVSL